MPVAAKFQCVRNSPIPHGGDSRQVEFTAVASDDPSNPNSQWSKWTPSGTVILHVSNPLAYDKFVVGKEYIATFEEA